MDDGDVVESPTGEDSSRRNSSHVRDGHGLYGLSVNPSSSSVFEDVEMAQDELYSGPVAESLPTSLSAFAHRRSRADSTASFHFYDEEALLEDEDISSSHLMGDGGVDHVDEIPFGLDGEEEEAEDEDSAEMELQAVNNDYVLHRRASTQSRGSVRSRLLQRADSALSLASSYAGTGRTNQKIYMASEDLTIVVAGFRTSTVGFAAYIAICVCTFGLAWLVFRWIPRWHVRLVGRPSPLRECDWTVVENQWGEMAILDVQSRPYGRPLSSVFGPPRRKMSASYSLGYEDEDSDPIITELRSLDYRYVRLFFHQVRDRFQLCNGWRDAAWTDVHSIRAGIDTDEKSRRDTVFGSNLIDIEEKSVFRLLVDEVFHPFYVFQIASIILWSADNYYYYAAAIFVISFGSIATTLYETRATMKRLREMSRFECDVRVLRGGFWRYVSSGDLVPGDIYEASDPNLAQFPADSLLLSGDCIVNESMLTGESVPVSKIPTTDEAIRTLNLAAATLPPEQARHFLFCGTKIIRARRPQRSDGQEGEAVALAMVVRTGFNTTKGSLVRSMLFPKPSGFKFYRDSFRYISVMAVIAILGFLVSLVNFIRLGMETHKIIFRALDIITITVPPALPATLTIGTGFALRRLKRKQIFCISPQRVNVGGKLDIMCFDKTGTLTEEGLDILGVRVVSKTSNRFSDVMTDPEDLARSDSASSSSTNGSSNGNGVSSVASDGDVKRAALFTMATCHSLRSVDGELVGDPMDLKMFEFTRWSFDEGDGEGGDHQEAEDDLQQQGNLTPSIARPTPEMKQDLDWEDDSGHPVAFELGILKSFEFVSQLRRASVVVRTFGRQSGDVYVKGAPECMRDICRPESFPSDYDELLSHYTHKGYRVIGCATKHIKKLSWVKAQKMKRADVESELDFVGFIVFENKLKPTTAGVLDELLRSNIGAVMVTGDNILTAISVARECNLMDKTAHCFVPRFVEGNSRESNSKLQWESIDDSIFHLDEETLMPLPPPPEGDASLPYPISNLRNYSIAVSGDVFRWVVDFAKPEVLHRMLVRGKVFARMSPDEKHELVEKLQSIDYCCGFCGDGANDCSALKAADVGISLSEAEASVAAPFTSRVFDIRCVPDVIREGRAALVTSFSCFKYMSLYSAIQFTTVSFLYARGSNLGDLQFLLIDLFLILPIAVFMGWAGAYPELCRKRPTADLVSRKVLTPLLSQMGVCFAVQAVAYSYAPKFPGFIDAVPEGPTEISNTYNTGLFLTSCFEYIFAGLVLNAGPPFREAIHKNWPFVATILSALLFTTFMVWDPYPGDWIKKSMQLVEVARDFKLAIVGLGLAYFLVAWVGEAFVFLRLARLIGRAKQALSGRAKKRKQYKVIQEQMRL